MAWGTAKPGTVPTIVATVAGADVTLTAGSDITGFTPAAALTGGYAGGWCYVVWVFATIVMGATAPTALVVKLKTATPTTLDTFTVPPANLVNNAIVPLSVCLIGTSSATLYYPTGDTPVITFNCTTTAATLKAQSRAVFSFFETTD
jgi:hypothetical protein